MVTVAETCTFVAGPVHAIHERELDLRLICCASCGVKCGSDAQFLCHNASTGGH